MSRACALALLAFACTTPAPQQPRAEASDDLAVLGHALDEAWAWPSRATIDTVHSLPPRLREAAVHARDAKELCAGLAEALRTTGVRLELDGVACLPHVAPEAVGKLDRVPAGKNYQLRIDRAIDHEVGILTIAHFVDPADPGWHGFADAMKQLAKVELVIVDVQHADGDDPRAGFAVLAALGLELYERAYLRPAVFHDNPFAKAARASYQARVPGAPAPRSRTLWSSFSTGDDVKRIAREIVPGLARNGPVVQSRFLVGPDCGRACQLMIRLVQWSGTDIYGTFEDRVSGDELGDVRLPHSGIVATFPTTSYGTYILGGPDHRQLPADYGKTLLSGLHAIGHQRAESVAWKTRPLPECAKLAPAPNKVSGCRDGAPVAAGAPERVVFVTSVDVATARRFFANCQGIQVDGGMDLGVTLASQVYVTGSRAAIAQAAGAPFVQTVEWPCQQHVEPN